MGDLIWIGNALYPRWVVFVAIAVAVVVASFVIAIIIVTVQAIGNLALVVARALLAKFKVVR